MLSLSEFFEVPEGVEFKVNGFEKYVYMIKDNTLMSKKAETNDNWRETYDFINLVVQAGKITIIPQILTDKERDYLKGVIYPVRDKVEEIIKFRNSTFSIEYIKIYLKDCDNISLYKFETNTQFKGMEANKEYTLKDLGLEE